MMRSETPSNEGFLQQGGSQPAAGAATLLGDLEAQQEPVPAVVTEGSVHDAGADGAYKRRRRLNIALIGTGAVLVTLALTLGLVFGLRGSGASDQAPTNPPGSPVEDSDIVRFTVLHINDLYELDGVAGGTVGGVARVQTLMNQLREANPNFFSVLSGDMFSPSALGAIRLDGELLAGRQMVDVLNAMNWDYMGFGNHEFDISAERFQKRLAEAEFTMFASNIFNSSNEEMFANTEWTPIIDIQGVRVGLVGLCIVRNDVDYVNFTDPTEVAQAEVKRLKEEEDVDVIIMVTHVSRKSDTDSSPLIPDADIIMGGHEHVWSIDEIENGPNVYKADANARSAWVHEFTFNKTSRERVTINSRFVEINNNTFELDEPIDDIVTDWLMRALTDLTVGGIPANETVTFTNETLDGREVTVRFMASRLTDLIAEGIFRQFQPGATQFSLFNGGAVRIDDELTPGKITGYDVLRIMPFGGGVSECVLNGETLSEALTIGMNSVGLGAYLHYYGLRFDNFTGLWVDNSNNMPIDSNTDYTVAISDFLIDQGDFGLDLLLISGGRVRRTTTPPKDLWTALVDELIRVYPRPPEADILLADANYVRPYLRGWIRHLEKGAKLQAEAEAAALLIDGGDNSNGGRKGGRTERTGLGGKPRSAPYAGNSDNIRVALERARARHMEL